MNAVKAWSYSRYALYELCPLKFKLKHIDRIPEPGSDAMERGNAVHKELADYLVSGAGAGTLPVIVKSREQQAIYREMRAIPDENKVVEQQWGFTAKWRPTGWFGGDTWFRSILDYGVMYDDNTFEAVDHKTGKRYGSNDEQVETQALAVMCKFQPVTHVTTRLIYLDGGEEEIAEFEARLRPLLAAKWEKKVQPMFTDTIFAPRPNEKCRFCHYAKSKAGLCRFG